jgi:hypothetical protein
LVCFTGSRAAELESAALWRYAHPDARIVAGLQFGKLRQSPLFDLAKSLPAGTVSSEGFEFIEELDSVLISAPVGDSTQFLAALEGRFKLQELRERAVQEGAAATRYAGVELIGGPISPGVQIYVAVIRPGCLLVGDSASVRAAIDRSRQVEKTVIGNAVLRRGRELADAYEIWVASDVPPGKLIKKKGSTIPFADEIQGLEGGISIRDGLALELALRTDTEESARSLASTLQGFVGIAALQQQGNPPADLLRNVRIAASGSDVNVVFSATSPQLAQALGEMTATVKTSAAPRVVSKPEPPKTIRIHGLEEGTREIPFSR